MIGFLFLNILQRFQSQLSSALCWRHFACFRRGHRESFIPHCGGGKTRHFSRWKQILQWGKLIGRSALELPSLPRDKVHPAASKDATLAFLLPALLEAVDAQGSNSHVGIVCYFPWGKGKGLPMPCHHRHPTTQILELCTSLLMARQESHVRVQHSLLKFFGCVLMWTFSSMKEIN